jgi:hypothetical protein
LEWEPTPLYPFATTIERREISYSQAVSTVRRLGTRHIATQRKQRNGRVQVPRDPALDRAIKRGHAVMGPSTPTSKVVRELVPRGAEAFEGDETEEYLPYTSLGASS